MTVHTNSNGHSTISAEMLYTVHLIRNLPARAFAFNCSLLSDARGISGLLWFLSVSLFLSLSLSLSLSVSLSRSVIRGDLLTERRRQKMTPNRSIEGEKRNLIHTFSQKERECGVAAFSFLFSASFFISSLSLSPPSLSLSLSDEKRRFNDVLQ